MAKWVLGKTPTGTLELIYRNSITGASHACGEVRADTPLTLIVDWVVKSDASSAGDFILFPGGWGVVLMPAGALA